VNDSKPHVHPCLRVSGTVEVAVIGSGMSGAAVALELIRRGVQCVLLEGGPDAGLAHVGASAQTASWADPASDPWFSPFFERSDETVYPVTAGYRSRVGGRSLYWRGICLRIEPQALTEWPPEVCDLLQGDRGLYSQTEEALARWTGRETLWTARTRTELELTAQLRAAGLEAAPTPRAIRVLAGDRWEAYSPTRFVVPGYVLTGSRVSAIRPAPRACFDLTTADGARLLTARKVVLCAGVFGNLRLAAPLLGAAGNLSDDGVFYVTDHVASGVVLRVPSTARRALESSVYAGFHPEASSNVVMDISVTDGSRLVDVWAMGEQPPAAPLEVTIHRGVAHVALGYGGRAGIERRYHEQRVLLESLAERIGFPVLASATPSSYATAVAKARQRPGIGVPYRVALGELDHESGGLELRGKWVDSSGRLRHVDGVFVAGPALFPRAGAANPTLTNLALALHVAGQIG
jgi:FAD dependent oxidoreductase/GMC oxidoreductase